MVACNKVKPINISRGMAAEYLTKLSDLNEDIKNPKYKRFVPFYVWLHQVCNLVKLEVEQKKVLEKGIEIDEQVIKLEAEITNNQVVLAHLGVDTDSNTENQTMSKLWEGAVSKIHAELDSDLQKVKTFESQHIGSVKNY